MTQAAERKTSFRSLAGALALVWVGFTVYTVLQQISGMLTLRNFTPGFVAPLVLLTLYYWLPWAMASIRDAIQRVDPDMPIERMQTLDTIRSAYLATPRLTALLLSLFAGLALCITVTGNAGVIATSVAQRTREIGLRIVVGASTRGVPTMVLTQGFKLVGIGVAAGVPLAVIFGLALRSYLFDTAPADPLMLVAVALALGAAGALGCVGPALRATRIDPITALRAD